MSIKSTAGDDQDSKLVSVCLETQSMIDIAAKQLFGLRQCSGTDELIKKEIWESETKLICLFSKMLITKAKLKNHVLLHSYPNTEQWLEIVGIKKSRIEALSHKLSLQKMLEYSGVQLEEEIRKVKASDEEVRMLVTAVQNLNKCRDDTNNSTNSGWMSLDYHWSTFKQTSSTSSMPISNLNNPANNSSYSPHLDNSPKFHHRHHHHHHQQRPSTSSLPNESAQISSQILNADASVLPTQTPISTVVTEIYNQTHYIPASPHPNFIRYTPSPTPQLKSQKNSKFPTTPPPNRKNKLIFEPLTKSKSHESQLSLKVNLDNSDNKKMQKRKPGNIHLNGSSETIPPSSVFRKRSSGNSEDTIGRISGQSSPLYSSPFRSPQICKYDSGGGENSPYRNNQLGVPSLSPGGSQHKFKNKMVWSTCDYCKKQLLRGRVCKYCKCKFHSSCVNKASAVCKFQPDDDVSINQYRQQLLLQQHNNNNNNFQHLHYNNNNDMQQQQHLDSSSTSSANSSTPSSPAMIAMSNSHLQQLQQQQQHYYYSQYDHASQFVYPDPKLPQNSSGLISENSSINPPTVAVSNADAVNTNASSGSDKTVTGSGSSGDPNNQLDHCDSIDSNDDNALHRDNSISIGLKEWNIPYNELKINEFVGAGRFGTVHKGYWHGEVAIKELNWCTNTDDQVQLQAFKLEVTNLRKTRHENLVLFIGACMEPPKLAIITSFVNGLTLYERIRVRREKLALNHVVVIASQIAVGLGYLHSKGIIHKDLKTKNIFVESLKNSSAVSKVVISDYGLFCVTKLCSGARKGGWLEIPNGWLSYISPEIARKLKAGNQNEVDLPFSKESDIYAFGTIWYELLTSDLPHDKQPPECVIWRVGKGDYHPNMNLQTEFKEILMKCWSLEAKDRPNCQQICKSLEMLPRKRLARSPSHPVQLSRSAESLF